MDGCLYLESAFVSTTLEDEGDQFVDGLIIRPEGAATCQPRATPWVQSHQPSAVGPEWRNKSGANHAAIPREETHLSYIAQHRVSCLAADVCRAPYAYKAGFPSSGTDQMPQTVPVTPEMHAILRLCGPVAESARTGVRVSPIPLACILPFYPPYWPYAAPPCQRPPGDPAPTLIGAAHHLVGTVAPTCTGGSQQVATTPRAAHPTPIRRACNLSCALWHWRLQAEIAAAPILLRCSSHLSATVRPHPFRTPVLARPHSSPRAPLDPGLPHGHE